MLKNGQLGMYIQVAILPQLIELDVFRYSQHNYVQAICSSQKRRSLSAAVRGQARLICMFRCYLPMRANLL